MMHNLSSSHLMQTYCVMTLCFSEWESRRFLLLLSYPELTIACQATQDRTGQDSCCPVASFFSIQQILRLLQTNFVPVQHKRDFFSVSTISVFIGPEIQIVKFYSILLCFVLPHCVHLCSRQCKCAHGAMRRRVLENEPALSAEKQQAARFRDFCSLGREETLVKAQGGNGGEKWGI